MISASAWSKTADVVILELQSQVKGKNLTLKAPIDSANLTIDEAGVVLTMSIGLDRVKTGNVLLDIGLSGFLSSYGARELQYVGSGPSGIDPMLVGGVATSGRVVVELELALGEIHASEVSMTLQVSGTAVFDDVEVPIPGIGRLSDLTLQVAAEIPLELVV
jgi:hypothetical protein